MKALSSELYPAGFRYRKHHKKVFGNPDIAFVSSKIAVFVDSDFWHGKKFNKLKPKLKSDFWIKKIEGNIKRDRKVNHYLRKNGWAVFRLSERQLKSGSSKFIQAVRTELVKRRDF
jgi:DNA mismatch endonuclease (patch repair protein)